MMAYEKNNMQLSSFETEYYNIQKNRTDLNIAVAPLNTVYCHALGIKGDFALVGGNQNHPNDFSVRLYAQTVAAVLGAYDTPILSFNASTQGEVGKALNVALKHYTQADSLTWSVVEGALPDGITLTDGVLTGTPTAAGTYTFTVKAQNGTRSDTRIMEVKITDDEAANTSAPTTGNHPSSGASSKSNLPLILTAVGATLAVVLTAVVSSIVVKKATKTQQSK
ncbi:MAG: hypothetical protein E7618_01830 [Ruminococcaceae bacterium]|nr:hypothetical protein [Oscillospiraceae bacterium]